MKAILLLTALLLSACVSNPNQPVINYDSEGRIISQTAPVMSGKEYVQWQSVMEAEKSNSAYYAAQQAKYESLDSEDVALVDAIAALAGNKNPTNYNDTVNVKTKAKSALTQSWLNFGLNALGLGVRINESRHSNDDLKIFAQNQGIRINADNGSSVTGAIGEGNDYEYTEQVTPPDVFAGIPVEPIVIEDTRFGSTPSTTTPAGEGEGGDDSDGLNGLQSDGSFAGSGSSFCTPSEAAENGGDCPQ